MTEEEILAMEAGRKLDDLVAEEVMGIEVEYPYVEGFPYHLVEKAKGQKVWDAVNLYSTNTSAAWQVVEKLREIKDSKGNQLLCCLKIYCDVPGEVWDIHWSYSELSVMNDGHKDHKLPLSWYSFPEAICKAALIAKSKERR